MAIGTGLQPALEKRWSPCYSFATDHARTNNRWNPALRELAVRPKAIAMCVGLLGLAAVLRLYQLGTQDYWLDELHSMANSAGRRAELEAIPFGKIERSAGRATDLNEGSSIASVWRNMRHDSHPPVYFILLYCWRGLWGDGEIAVRCLPVLFSILSLLPLLQILANPPNEYRSECTTPCRDSIANWAGVFLAFSATHIWMAQENRPYSLAILLTSCCFLAVIRGETAWASPGGTRKWLLAAFCGGTAYLSVLTHYFAALPLLGQVVYVAVRFRGPALRWWLGSMIVAAALFGVTWFPTLLSQLDFIRNQPWLTDNRPDQVTQTLLRMTDLPIRLLVQCPRFQSDFWRSIIGLCFLTACIVLAAKQSRSLTLLLGTWFLVPTIIFAALDLATGKQLLNHVRYPVIAVPGIVGLAALGAARFGRKFQWAVGGVLVLLMAFRIHLPAAANVHARPAVEFLETVSSPEELVIYDAIGWPRDWVPQFQVPISYYWKNQPGQFLLLRDPPEPRLIEEIRGFRSIVVISPRVNVDPNPIPDHFQLTDRTSYFWQVGWIYRYVAKN